ncbi:polyadenylate-binding protein RBP45-like [Coffea arabica]|uniref:Polyadenylate-binding protein RBP45-like n=1 Tax=Coffea arabica TaxID=13443 RepID=A0A6P6UCN6_COFAR|nr:polyadenylate-binding protein RBP45-like [Coffea arabica]XP_027086223.1 polyadenylate-binding protein RBP45-like [Coffea arabica]XP_027088223.1 polyadenylate-binding protein RBP45-like [Coffea arabica]XP_027088224.1 polyadenylate-binding protein RBP45-like [Coffea arabica]
MMQPATTMVPPPQQQQQYQQQPPPPQQWMAPQQQPPQPQYQVPPPQQQQLPAYYYQQPPPQQQQPPQQYAASVAAVGADPNASDGIRSLWIGDLQYWMDEQYLLSCFSQTGEVLSAKVIRNKQTGQSEGYGFIEFVSHAGAERNLQAYNGTLMPNVEQHFRLNWASMGAGEKRSDDSPDYTIFVGDLAADVTDYMLQETFRAHYSSVKGAKVVTDRITGRTKGYGFVRFGDESEQLHAMTEMNGKFCSTRPMRIGPAANKKTMGGQTKASYQGTQGTPNEDDPSNTTLFVGNLDSNVTDEHLRQVFGNYGQLLHVKIPVGKRCGFVQFADRSCAEEALRLLNGTQLGGQNIRLSWGRSPSNKQPQVDASQWNSGYYGYASGYETYGYAPAAQDPNMYYGGYPGYGNYPPQTQQQPQMMQQPQ